MSSQPPVTYAASDPFDVDRSHLKALAICHWVVGGLTFFSGSFGLFYMAIGIAALTGNMDFSPPPATATTQSIEGAAIAAKIFGFVFVGVGGLITLLFWSLASTTIYSGFCIQKRRKRVFSIVIAAINCLCFPFGTVLGVFTLIVLLRESVRQRYDYLPTPAEAPKIEA